MFRLFTQYLKQGLLIGAMLLGLLGLIGLCITLTGCSPTDSELKACIIGITSGIIVGTLVMLPCIIDARDRD